MDPACRFHPWNRANPFPLLGQLTRKMGGLSRILSIQTYQWLPQSGGKNYESASNSIFFATEAIVGWCVASNTEKRKASQTRPTKRPEKSVLGSTHSFFPRFGVVLDQTALPDFHQNVPVFVYLVQEAERDSRRFGARIDFCNSNGLSSVLLVLEVRSNKEIAFTWYSDDIQHVRAHSTVCSACNACRAKLPSGNQF